MMISSIWFRWTFGNLIYSSKCASLETFLNKQNSFFVDLFVSGSVGEGYEGAWPFSWTKWHFSAWFAWSQFEFLSFFYFQIYTEWANYYLERHKSKRKVVDLSIDARDGLLLAEIIEAVTSFKVPDLIKKPKNQQQMVSLKSIKERSFDCQLNVNLLV